MNVIEAKREIHLDMNDMWTNCFCLLICLFFLFFCFFFFLVKAPTKLDTNRIITQLSDVYQKQQTFSPWHCWALITDLARYEKKRRKVAEINFILLTAVKLSSIHRAISAALTIKIIITKRTTITIFTTVWGVGAAIPSYFSFLNICPYTNSNRYENHKKETFSSSSISFRLLKKKPTQSPDWN